MDGCPLHSHYSNAVVGGMRTDWLCRQLQHEYKRGWQNLPDDPHDPGRAHLPANARSACLIGRR